MIIARNPNGTIASNGVAKKYFTKEERTAAHRETTKF